MTMQYSTKVRNAGLDSREVEIGASPICRLLSGSPPANCGTADSGTLLAEGTLPADWMQAASAAAKVKSATAWTLTGVVPTSGTAGYFRVYRAGSPSECDIQGTVTITGSGGDMTVDNTSIANGQVVTVTTFTLTAGNP